MSLEWSIIRNFDNKLVKRSGLTFNRRTLSGKHSFTESVLANPRAVQVAKAGEHKIAVTLSRPKKIVSPAVSSHTTVLSKRGAAALNTVRKTVSPFRADLAQLAAKKAFRISRSFSPLKVKNVRKKRN
jgi:hypothetical protein